MLNVLLAISAPTMPKSVAAPPAVMCKAANELTPPISSTVLPVMCTSVVTPAVALALRAPTVMPPCLVSRIWLFWIVA